MKYTTPAERIAELVQEHGGPTAAAAACGIHPSTFSRMLAGSRTMTALPDTDEEYTDESYAAEQIGSDILDGLMREADEGAYLSGTASSQPNETKGQ